MYLNNFLHSEYCLLIEVDGQMLYQLTPSGVDYFLSHDIRWQLAIWKYIDKWRLSLIPLMLATQNVHIAIGIEGVRSPELYFLQEKDQEVIRFWPEKIECYHCSWIGWGGNPFISDCSFGAHDKVSFYGKLKSIQRIGCPVCEKELFRPRLLFTLTIRDTEMK